MKAAILGYGKSGKGAERLLKHTGVTDITVYDDRLDWFMNISDFVNTYDQVVASPGIKLDQSLLFSKNLTSEIEMAAAMVTDKRIIVITGTNGKSTVTYITSQIINNAGTSATYCGNIGKTMAETVLDESPDVYVVELSSFQIELLRRFKAHSVCITNISPDHLDRYSCFEEYVTAKYRITEFVRNDGAIIFDRDNEFAPLLEAAHLLPIEIDNDLKSYPTLKDNVLDFNKFSVDISNYDLFGRHNLVNLAYALELADSVCDFNGDVTHVINGLRGLEHRCEFVAEIDGVTYINDSKGTNVDSTLTALRSSIQPTVLILGGKDKNSDFTILKDEINSKVIELVLYGEAAPVIEAALENDITCEMTRVETVADAVAQSEQVKEDGLTVLFSPACASFDQYSSFEKRGEDFKQIVLNLKGDQA